MRILVVEDEAKLADAVRAGLEAEQCEVVVARTGDEGLRAALSGSFDVILLDVMLPGRDGLAVLAEVRRRRLATPVLLLTARDTVDDRVRGLDAGADDYLVKPFAFPELLARVRALARRGQPDAGDTLRLADLVMDVSRRQVTRAGRPLDLTAREFEMLEYLLRQAGRVVSREMLARDVWKTVMRYTPIDNVIDVHVARLRRKLDDPFDSALLHTVRGVGFVLREQGS